MLNISHPITEVANIGGSGRRIVPVHGPVLSPPRTLEKLEEIGPWKYASDGLFRLVSSLTHHQPCVISPSPGIFLPSSCLMSPGRATSGAEMGHPDCEDSLPRDWLEMGRCVHHGTPIQTHRNQLPDQFPAPMANFFYMAAWRLFFVAGLMTFHLDLTKSCNL
jgi:hypothetical protein